MNYCNIRISKENREELKKIGRKSETYDELISYIIEHIQTCDHFWSDRI